jgi:hypothetical protein
VTADQAASLSRALALIIAAPFSAIMIVGALVFVELTAGITERRAAPRMTWLRSRLRAALHDYAHGLHLAARARQ